MREWGFSTTTHKRKLKLTPKSISMLGLCSTLTPLRLMMPTSSNSFEWAYIYKYGLRHGYSTLVRIKVIDHTNLRRTNQYFCHVFSAASMSNNKCPFFVALSLKCM